MPIRGVIAMIDDDSRVREAVESLLVAKGFEVELYGSVEDFLEARGYLMIDCVISDLGLPGMSGHDLAGWMDRTRPELPLILVSGKDGTPQLQQEFHRVILEKPFAASHLVSIVEQSLKSV